MWGGGYVMLWDNLKKFNRTEDLLGISTYIDRFIVETDDKDKEDRDKLKFITENSKKWKKIDVWDKANKYFDWNNTYSVRYTGFLLNHTKKLAIDLADYHQQSKYTNQKGIYMSIDVIPVLTETGEGTHMAFLDGITIDTTETLACTWCGDLLQIVEEIPEDYQLINCCFAEIWSKAKCCYRKFGTNENGFVLKDAEGNLFEAVDLDFYEKRHSPDYIKTEVLKDKVKFTTVKKNKI